MNSGRSITLKYATKTDSWKRYNLATDTQEKFAKAIKKADVPAELSKTKHPSKKDSYPHYTTIY
ncbi:hypothetical protein K469DRAFT_802186 [Zopfia rhizophila CBS 207.26]|uniref:Uncharacterized protein n=1 Tax=Zopfia rhizophila CBS 207.26 TaxID=1314779 RepID=A0A6A6DKM4_9PEZI|nr:hypothetical protein K469DRAFT_802186 [Zopfia rhizophila CBS 207.26]